jgi:hypothetical protein
MCVSPITCFILTKPRNKFRLYLVWETLNLIRWILFRSVLVYYKLNVPDVFENTQEITLFLAFARVAPASPSCFAGRRFAVRRNVPFECVSRDVWVAPSALATCVPFGPYRPTKPWQGRVRFLFGTLHVILLAMGPTKLQNKVFPTVQQNWPIQRIARFTIEKIWIKERKISRITEKII